MAKKKFTQLTAATLPLAGTEIFALVQGGQSKQAPVSAISGGTDHWKGDYDWDANADALPTWSPGDYGRSDGDRGSFGDVGFVPDGCLIFKTGSGTDFNADFIFLRSNI